MFLLYLIALFFIIRHLITWKAPEIKELMSQVKMLKLDQLSIHPSPVRKHGARVWRTMVSVGA